MKRYLPLLLLAASACSTVRTLPSTDSTRVEVRTETVIQHDTAYVELPVIIEKVSTLDTTSTLENTYARSEATVASGTLRHSLETKPVSVPVRIENQIVYRDSLVYRDRIQAQTVEVERKLSWWQKTKMALGIFALIEILLGTIYIVYKIFPNLLKLKRL